MTPQRPPRSTLRPPRRRAALALLAALAAATTALAPARAEAQDAGTTTAAPLAIEAPAPWSGPQLPPLRITAVPPPPGALALGLLPPGEPSTLPDRLRAVLRYQAGLERTSRYLGGATVAGIGVISAVGGVLTLTNAGLSSTLVGAVIGWTMVAVAPVYAVLGGVMALIPGTYERFSAEYERDLRTARSPGEAALRALIRWQMEVDRQRAGQRTAAVTGFVGGAIALGYGGFLLAAQPTVGPAFSAGFGATFLLLGAIDIGAAVSSLVLDPPAAQLLRVVRMAAGLERVPALAAPAAATTPPPPQRAAPPAPRVTAPNVSFAPLPGGAHVALGWLTP